MSHVCLQLSFPSFLMLVLLSHSIAVTLRCLAGAHGFSKISGGHNPTFRLHQEQDSKLRGLFKAKPTVPAALEALNIHQLQATSRSFRSHLSAEHREEA